MSKAILFSVPPRQCLNIANDKQSVIVTKTKPKLKTPFKAYIYCPNKKPYLVWGDVMRGNWETEFTALSGYSRKDAEKIWEVFNGNIIGEFICDTIITDKTFGHDALFNGAACMIETESVAKSNNKEMYGLHISNLEIYDCPKPLNEFNTIDKDAVRHCGHRHQSYCSAMCSGGYIKNGFYCDKTADWCTQCTTKPLTKAPSGWCYVEELNFND